MFKPEGPFFNTLSSREETGSAFQSVCTKQDPGVLIPHPKPFLLRWPHLTEQTNESQGSVQSCSTVSEFRMHGIHQHHALTSSSRAAENLRCLAPAQLAVFR